MFEIWQKSRKNENWTIFFPFRKLIILKEPTWTKALPIFTWDVTSVHKLCHIKSDVINWHNYWHNYLKLFFGRLINIIGPGKQKNQISNKTIIREFCRKRNLSMNSSKETGSRSISLCFVEIVIIWFATEAKTDQKALEIDSSERSDDSDVILLILIEERFPVSNHITHLNKQKHIKCTASFCSDSVDKDTLHQKVHHL